MAGGKHFKTDASVPREQVTTVAPARHAEASHAGAAGSSRPRRRVPKRAFVLAALALAVCIAGVGGVIAWLTSSNFVSNVFSVGKNDVEIEETFDDPKTVKEDVYVTNNSNIAVYVRAQVNVYWQDASGTQLWEQPVAGEDYTEWESGENAPAEGWVKHTDGFWYWTEPLAAEGSTGNLIDSISVSKSYTDGRQLVVDIAVQSIQADPADAVRQAWGISPGADGKLPVDSATTTQEAI